MNEIGVIGLGNAGRPLATRLLEKGYALRIYDLSEEAMAPLVKLGAVTASSAADAARPLTLLALPGPRDVDRAVFGEEGVLRAFPSDGVLIDTSGIDPPTTVRVKEALEACGAHLVGCTLHAAAAPAVTIPAGTLSICAGASRPTLERALPLLQDLAMTVVCVPDPIIPKLMKIGVIMMAVTNHVAAAEVAIWLSSQGVDPMNLYRLMQETESAALTSYLSRILRGGLQAGGNIRNTHKDLELALRLAADRTLPLPLTTVAEQILQMGRGHGLEGKDLPEALCRLYEALTGQTMPRAELPRENLPELREPRVVWLGFEG